jgi:hypothetical protein
MRSIADKPKNLCIHASAWVRQGFGEQRLIDEFGSAGLGCNDGGGDRLIKIDAEDVTVSLFV